ncbi:NAD-dependent epimerase/dehydratase family protein [Pseudomonas donghuensis]|uniref:NAD-dependent epimerase/dehydratase family protein n=1 Tax=Pseudomonas donghuensis TaxID=1163398 RepID=UPI00215EB777|nr:NAD-dependent epimerase/dehydratase family protein [Pseudomonas donghuensis]UVL28177.1 NAD-dependent epimerase/dehydratase family protein [Pseudomonas donghuensis]
MRILVTGASGFIGRAVVEALVARGDEVRGLVRSAPDDLAGITLIQASLEDEVSLQQALEGVECVVHLAGRAHLLADSAADPLAEFRAVNCEATLRLGKLAQEAGVKRFVFMSSIGVNGSYTNGQALSESSPVAPHADYAQSKLEAEQGLRALMESGPTDLVIIRPPLVYAAHAPGNFRRLLKLVATGAPLPFSLVHNQRSMVALENLVDFILISTHHAQAANQLYLVADEQSVSTREIVEYLAEGMSQRCTNLPVPPILLRWGLTALGKGALYTQLCGSLVVSPNKARELGWVPRLSAKDALVAAGRRYRSVKR